MDSIEGFKIWNGTRGLRKRVRKLARGFSGSMKNDGKRTALFAVPDAETATHARPRQL
jgi:hypothetical protein